MIPFKPNRLEWPPPFGNGNFLILQCFPPGTNVLVNTVNVPSRSNNTAGKYCFLNFVCQTRLRLSCACCLASGPLPISLAALCGRLFSLARKCCAACAFPGFAPQRFARGPLTSARGFSMSSFASFFILLSFSTNACRPFWGWELNSCSARFR